MENQSFYSIDRLVEFGMGMAVAQQMVQTMNHAMRDMYIPGAMNAMPTAVSKSYYVVLDGHQAGPFGEQDMMRLIAEHRISKDTFVWMPGMPAWKTIETVPEVLKLVALMPPPLTQSSI